ncbi:MAG: ABC transporter substrate-binding protein, partial [Chloroflexota bacterium]|nr:ABC transporter substrate-binding protein [Chloroflexota bacterium]
MVNGKIGIVISVLVILGLLLAACAPAASPTPAPTKPAPTVAPAAPAPTAAPAPAAEKPRSGGILTSSFSGDPSSFDSHQERTVLNLAPVAPAYSLLVQNDPADNSKIIPDLAERWEVSPDGKVYTFYIRKGVKFHDGKPATSADVKANFDRIIFPPKGVLSHRKDTLQSVEKLEAPDDYTVRFILKFPHAGFLQMVGNPYNSIFPKHVLEAKGDMKKDIVGTGPFKLKDFNRGVSFELVKNPDYFVPGRPYLDGITFYIIKDA